jgi:hypothetical protein
MGFPPERRGVLVESVFFGSPAGRVELRDGKETEVGVKLAASSAESL